MMCKDQGHTGAAGPLTFSSRVYDSTDAAGRGGNSLLDLPSWVVPRGTAAGAALTIALCVCVWGLGWGAASLGRQV